MKKLNNLIFSILPLAFTLNTCNPLIKLPKNDCLDYYLNTINSFSNDIKNIKYVSDFETYGKQISYWQNPRETIKRGKGNCSDKAIFLNYLLKDKLDIELVYGIYRKNDTIMHIWQQFEVNKEIYVVESSSDLNIYKKDSLIKSNNSILYTPIVKYNNLQNKIDNYNKRNRTKIKFKYYR
jgi:hypothetical protein